MHTSAGPSNFHRFQWALDAHLTNSSGCAECIPRLLVPARKRNVSFSSSFELGARHLSLSPRPSSYFSRRLESSGTPCLARALGRFAVARGSRFRRFPSDETGGCRADPAPATLSVLTLHSELQHGTGKLETARLLFHAQRFH